MLGLLLLLVPILLVGWFLPDVFGILVDSSGRQRQKPMSAEAKFLWMAFAILLAIGFIGWWAWHRIGVH
ncbi:hypothetical protein [Hymenobacter negativus]|uniref:DUF3302 domain-containing protein n=1 Tax=Hymenobacter negativus TaxID=2795026 RepID=A0ABS3QAG2_9BACT|nr:hypothetical protein [Hymenobacter negativus]MBO2007998.1 hypothetical protein [Hymenobacter negativus]